MVAFLGINLIIWEEEVYSIIIMAIIAANTQITWLV